MLPHPLQHTWPLAPLQNKNILKYAQISGSEPKSMILNIEGHSSKYMFNVTYIRRTVVASVGSTCLSKTSCTFTPEASVRPTDRQDQFSILKYEEALIFCYTTSKSGGTTVLKDNLTSKKMLHSTLLEFLGSLM